VAVKKSLFCVSLVLTLGVFRATAEEMATAPAYIITGPTNALHWTGLYVGGNGGYVFGNSSVAYTPNDPASRQQSIPSTDFKMNGGSAGGQIGFNWQLTSLWLAGVEADYQWSSSKGTTGSAFHLTGVAGTSNMVGTESIKSFGTLRLRVGAIPASALLLYGTAGLAYGRVAEGFNLLPSAIGSSSTGGFSYSCVTGGAACFAGSSSNGMWGWTAGAGAEYAITNNLTLKAEVLYINLGVPSGTAAATATLAATAASSYAAGFASVSFIVARGGLNFQF
jgi:outer membrane immunogenic protein